MENIKISIITPCFNSERTIERTIKSILNQDYENYEYIIIDGGSTDNTLNIINSYAEKFNGKMKLISEKDEGIYDAMNKGIKLSTGDLVGIIISDDFYEKNALSIVKELYKNNSFQIIYGGLRSIDECGNELAICFFHHNNIKHHMINHPSCFVSKKIYDEISLYDKKYKCSADYDFMIKMSMNEKIEFIPCYEVIANFTTGGMSSTNQSPKDKNEILYKYGYKSKKKYMLCKIKYFIKDLLKI